jgi:hypothetical protein
LAEEKSILLWLSNLRETNPFLLNGFVGKRTEEICNPRSLLIQQSR